MNCFRFAVRLHYIIAYLCGFLSVFIGFGPSMIERRWALWTRKYSCFLTEEKHGFFNANAFTFIRKSQIVLASFRYLKQNGKLQCNPCRPVNTC